MYDVASSILQQKLAQVEGVGQVVRRRRRAAGRARRRQPDGAQQHGPRPRGRAHGPRERQRQPPEGRDRRTTTRAWSLATTDQLLKAAEYRPLVIALPERRRRAPLRRRDGRPTRSRTSARAASPTASPPIIVIIFRQPGANIIETVDRIRRCCPSSRPQIPPAIDLVGRHRPHARRSARRCTTSQLTLVISIALVILVVFVFLRNVRATLIPSVAVPVSLIGTFGVMYLLGYSLDNLSLMALTIATGFVVDDAIVVIENITRHLEEGMHAARGGAAGRRGDRLHGPFDQHLARRGVHPDPADGRHRRPALPRVRGDAVGRDRRLAGRLADHDAR